MTHRYTPHWVRSYYILKGHSCPRGEASRLGGPRRLEGRGRLTSPLAALLHAVLVDVQREEHVGVAEVVLIAVLLAAPPGGYGSIQEEGGLLRGGRPQLTLVLQLEDTREGLKLQAGGLPATRAWLSVLHSRRLDVLLEPGPLPMCNSQLNLFISEN